MAGVSGSLRWARNEGEKSSLQKYGGERGIRTLDTLTGIRP